MWDGLVAQPAEHLSLKQGDVGSIPTGATCSILGVSSNGKTVGLHPADEGSTPSTVHCCEGPGGGMADTRSSEGRAHRGVRVQVPPWSLFHERRCLWCNRRACDPVKVEAAGSTPPEHLRLPCLAASSAGPPKAGWPVRLWHGVLRVVSRTKRLSMKPGWQHSCTLLRRLRKLLARPSAGD